MASNKCQLKELQYLVYTIINYPFLLLLLFCLTLIATEGADRDHAKLEGSKKVVEVKGTCKLVVCQVMKIL